MQFQVRALATGKLVILALDATDEPDARRQAAAQGYTVLGVQQERAPGGLSFGGKRFPLVLFSQELLALLEAGLSLVEALEALLEKEGRSDTKRILGGIVEQLYEGRPLSLALQKFPREFPELYIATVRASERTGDLPQALLRFVEYQQQMEAVRKKIVSASIYPVMLLLVGGLVVLFLLGYVVPRFSLIYADLGSNLPFMSRVLMRWGQLLAANGLSILVAVVASIAGLTWLFTRESTRSWLLARLWSIPSLGERVRVYQLARFYRTLGMLLQGGTPIVNALTMSADLLQQGLRARLEAASARIKEGIAMSTAMEECGLTTPVAQRMLVVGERTGRMGEMTDRVAAFYDEEIARFVDWFTRLFEPLLMAFIGVVIGGIVVLMYFPIFELAGSIQ
ncbi:MAG: type II secretion system F family protein [Pseudomonadota bacterium]|nr:type II secretion system F family protein [Pseudomonadota bacterium]